MNNHNIYVRGNFDGLFGAESPPQMTNDKFAVTLGNSYNIPYNINDITVKRLEHVFKEKSKFNVFDAFNPSTKLNIVNVKPKIIHYLENLPKEQAYDEYKNMYRFDYRLYYRPQLTPSEPIGKTIINRNEHGEIYEEIVLEHNDYRAKMKERVNLEQKTLAAPLYFLSNTVATCNDPYIKGVQIMQMKYCKANINENDKILTTTISESMDANMSTIIDILIDMLDRLEIKPNLQRICDSFYNFSDN